MKILVGYDSSNTSKRALEVAGERAKLLSAKVYVVTSLEGGNSTPLDEIESAKQGLEYAQQILNGEGISNETHLLIRGMKPGEDVVEFAGEMGVDEIIIGIKRRSKVGKLLFGSTAQFIILNAGCPVTTVR